MARVSRSSSRPPLPWIISPIKVNIGFALVGAVVGEFVASNQGLGYIAVQAAISTR